MYFSYSLTYEYVVSLFNPSFPPSGHVQYSRNINVFFNLSFSNAGLMLLEYCIRCGRQLAYFALGSVGILKEWVTPGAGLLAKGGGPYKLKYWLMYQF